MKNRMTLSILSLLVLGMFCFLALGYVFLPSLQSVKTDHLGGGIYKETITMTSKNAFGDSVVVEKINTGPRNEAGDFYGDVTIEEIRSDGGSKKKEICHIVNGYKHGKSLTYYGNDPDPWEVCYDNGYVVNCDGLSQTDTRGSSAFEILDASYPGYIFDKDTEQAKALVENYMDAIEARLATQTFEPWEFNGRYSDVLDSLEEEGNFDWQEQFLEARYNFIGVDLVKRFPYRLAQLDRYREGGQSSRQIIQNRYPTLEAYYQLFGATSEDLDTFFNDFDQRLDAIGALDTEDPLFVDSVEARIYRVLMGYLEEELTSSDILEFMAPPFNGSPEPNKLRTFLLGADGMVASPNASNKDMAFVMAILLSVEFHAGDPVLASVRKAWFAKQEVAMEPTLVSQRVDDPATPGIEIRGHVYENGGAEVIERGFVFATTHLPDIENAQTITVGSGTGEFTTTLLGLDKDKRYFVRGYAINEAGVAYGNQFEVTVQETSVLDPEASASTFSIFPNPARQELFLRHDDQVNGPVRLQVFDLQGRIVREEAVAGGGTVRIDLATLHPGAYLLQVSVGRSRSVQRFIKE